MKIKKINKNIKIAGLAVVIIASFSFLVLTAININFSDRHDQTAIIVRATSQVNNSNETTTPLIATTSLSTKAPASLPMLNASLKLNHSDVGSINDLSVNVIFSDRVAVSAPVAMTFDILDSSDAIVHSEQNNINIDTNRAFDKKFSGVSLSSGVYVLRLRIVYSGGTSEEFRSLFNISSSRGVLDRISSLPLFIGIIIFLTISVFFAWKKSYRIGKIEEEIKKMIFERDSRASGKK